MLQKVTEKVQRNKLITMSDAEESKVELIKLFQTDSH